MTLETNRLTLLPLSPHLLELWISDIPALERETGCTYRGEVMEEPFLGIVKGQLAITRGDEKNYLFHSFWLMIRRVDRVILGAADFKAPPDKDGRVEIGYGIAPEHEGRGYTTETVEAICRWALAQPGVQTVIAETEPDNAASRRVLEKCGMQLYRREENSLWWRRP